jgi:hypothetical protein
MSASIHNTSIDNALATYGISSIEGLCDDCVGGSSIRVGVEGDECDFRVHEFAKVHAAYEAEHVELGSGPVSPAAYSFELSSYQSQVSLEKSYLYAGINVTTIFFIIFIGLSAGVTFSFFCVSVFVTPLLLFLQLSISCMHHFLCMVPLETIDQSLCVCVCVCVCVCMCVRERERENLQTAGKTLFAASGSSWR